MTILEKARAMRDAMDKAGALLTAAQAASLVYLYKPWTPYVNNEESEHLISNKKPMHYLVGERIRFDKAVYECRQEHDAQELYTPDLIPALWIKFNVDNSGSAIDPIPYSAGMIIENGKYYTETGVLYLCIRDSVNPIYHNLSDLIGQYVEVV